MPRATRIVCAMEDRGGPNPRDLPLPIDMSPFRRAAARLARMDFDQLLIRFFGSAEIASLPPERLVDGVAALRLQFGFEKNEDKRFALWCLMFMLGIEPDLEDAFKNEDDRDAAREFMAAAEREMEEDD